MLLLICTLKHVSWKVPEMLDSTQISVGSQVTYLGRSWFVIQVTNGVLHLARTALGHSVRQVTIDQIKGR